MRESGDAWTLRPAIADDRPRVRDLIAAANAEDGVPAVVTLAEVEQDLDDDGVVLATDTRVAVDVASGSVVGYAFTFHLPSDVSEERCYIFGDVHPAWRGIGIGSALLTWGIDRGREQLLGSGNDLPRYIRVDAYEFCDADHRLFARHGFTPVRYFEELLRPLTDLPPEPAAAIDGLRIVPWPAARSEEIRAEKNAAFADHWGSTPTSVENWLDMTAGHGAFVECSFVCLDADDRIVAHCLNARYPEDDALLGRSDGWIDSLGTLRQWRGRGVASALIVASLHAFARAGLTHASITVDSEPHRGGAPVPITRLPATPAIDHPSDGDRVR